MKISLRTKLILCFVAVIFITGVVATIVGVQLIGIGIVREAQNKVTLDLNSAQQTYANTLERIQTLLSFTAMRRHSLVNAYASGNRALLLKTLQAARDKAGFDFLSFTDSRGTIILRASNPRVAGDCRAHDPIIRRAIDLMKPASSTQIITSADLKKESQDLAEQAHMKIIHTPHARPLTSTENTAGMVLKSAVPVLQNGALAGVLYGGILLNRNYDIVDKIKHIVYGGVTYEGKETGTATIFQGDLRIATNVRLETGKRAIGTRVSQEVYNRVIKESRVWKDRAFVVNDWYLTAYSPIRNISGDTIGMLYVGMLEKKYTDMKRTAFWLFAGLNIAGIVMATCIGFILARAIVRPVLMLKRGFSELEKGNFDSPVAATASDEIGSLAESFNKVRTELKNTYAKLQGKIEAADEDLKKAYLELQEKQDMLVQKEKLASIGQLSAGVAHELNNPLGTILVFSRMLLKELPPDDPRRADIEMIANEADRCKNIVRGLVDFARRSRVNKETIQPADTIHEVMQIMSEKAALCGVTIAEDVAHDLPDITADGAQLKQMLINLIDNAIDASGQSGTVHITARPASFGSGIELTVTDTGCGIPENCISEIFTPFFTTKEMGKGTGLGLAIVYGIVKMHSGSIDVDSAENKGTTFRITIPDIPAASPDQPEDSKT